MFYDLETSQFFIELLIIALFHILAVAIYLILVGTCAVGLILIGYVIVFCNVSCCHVILEHITWDRRGIITVPMALAVCFFCFHVNNIVLSQYWKVISSFVNYWFSKIFFSN